VRREADVKAVTDAPLIGHIPFDKSASKHPLLVGNATRGLRAEALRQLRTNLQFINIQKGRRSYVLTSPQPGDGKSTVAINLALTQAQAGLRVCLIDADLRRPSVANYLSIEGSVGLTDVLIGAVDLQSATQAWGDNKLDVIPAGRIPPNPSELLSGDVMQGLLRHLENLYDVVIIDAPPLLSVTDATILAKRTAGAIVVVGLGRHAVAKGQVARTFESLRAVDARVLGVVLNRIPQHGPDKVAFGSYDYQPSKTTATLSAKDYSHKVTPGTDAESSSRGGSTRDGGPTAPTFNGGGKHANDTHAEPGQSGAARRTGMRRPSSDQPPEYLEPQVTSYNP
jgi:capsular exopolysaccharide synthesis family protein